jgi:2-methylcitrate dehydratase PrpD
MTVRRLIVSSVLSAILTGNVGRAQSTSNQTINLPSVGIASTETVQVNVVNTANTSGTSCSASMSFLDTSGNTIGNTTTFTIGGGQTFSVNLPFSQVPGTAARAQIRAVVTVTTSSCALMSSLELFDTATGVLHALFSSVNPGTGVPGQPPFGP